MIDYTNDWYDGINDCYQNGLKLEIIMMYLESIDDIQGDNIY